MRIAGTNPPADDIEQLFDWNPVGPRFSNTILGTLVKLMRTPPPKGHRLLILATSSEPHVLQQLKVTRAFGRQIRVPAVQDARELMTVLSESGIFDGVADITEVVRRVVDYNGGSQRVGVGIKTILATAATAKVTADPVGFFAGEMAEQIVADNPLVGRGDAEDRDLYQA